MPNKTKLDKFEIDPAYDAVAYNRKRVDEVRSVLDRWLNIIDSISEPTLQLHCLFACIDCFAQEEASYPEGNPFCDFVIKYQRRYDYIKQVEPVTLYYRIEDIIERKPIIEGFDEEPVVSLDLLDAIDHTNIRTILNSGLSEQILDYLKQKIGMKESEKKAKEHRVVNLLYRMRSKLAHELSSMGVSHFEEQADKEEPFYLGITRTYVENGSMVQDYIYKLVIPVAFVKNVFCDCMENYLAECLLQCRDPFENNSMLRKHVLSWYDR